jgi:WD40 repeat protein
MRTGSHQSAAHLPGAIRLAVMIVVPLAACQSDTIDPAPVTTGTLRVLMRTSGATLDEDGYSYRIGSATVRLAVQDSQDIADLPASSVAVELGEIANNCAAYTPGPDSVAILAQQVATVSLVVVCDSALRNVVLYQHWPNNTTPELRLMRPDGTGKELFLPNAWSPAPTPNGTQVTYINWTNSQLWIIRSDKSKNRPVLPNLGGGHGKPDVSPDGRSVVFERWAGGLTEIYRAGLNGADVQQLTAGHQDFEPRWSPDGSLIVFTRLGGDNVQRVYRVPAAGGDTVRLTEEYSCCARWSPDGERLLVVGTFGLNTMAPDGSDVVRLQTQAVDGPAEWSPDGSEVLADAVFEDYIEIRRVPLDGTGVVTIAAEPVYNQLGRWLR